MNAVSIGLVALMGGSALGFALLGLGAVARIPEKAQATILKASMWSQLVCMLFTAGAFALGAEARVQTGEWVLFSLRDYAFGIGLALDRVAAVFLAMTVFFGNVVGFFSSRYMHREEGANRFFFVIAWLVFGMEVAILSSNLGLFFAGWELVGISSFLLIAFYWDREKPSTSAERVYAVYRVCDLGLFVSTLLAYAHWGPAGVPLWASALLASLILIAALGKSAQFPFLTWLPRALEGPTPSSAIFYGALSIHLGLLLLIRTEPLWRGVPGFSWVILAVGLFSGGLASAFGRLQSTIKGQIAYASSAQVGVMFAELALGFHNLLLIHFVGNALLRGYQLLSAPSIVAEQLKLQSSLGGAIYRSPWVMSVLFPRSMRPTLFAWALNEGYIDFSVRRALRFARTRAFQALALAGLGAVLIWRGGVADFMSLFCSASAVVCAYAALVSRKKAELRVAYIVSAHVLLYAVTGWHAHSQRFWWSALFGLGCPSVVLFWVLSKVRPFVESEELGRPVGAFQDFPLYGGLGLFAAFAVLGFPFLFTFVGEDMVFHYLLEEAPISAVMACATYVMSGIAMMNAFRRLFLGARRKTPAFQELDCRPLGAIGVCLVIGAFEWVPFFIL